MAALEELALGRANDAVLLALRHEELTREELEGLDLSMLSEIRRGAGGTVEVRLINRLDAIQLLLEEQRAREAGGGAAQFFSAMGKAAGLSDGS